MPRVDPGTRDILQDHVSHIQPIVSAPRALVVVFRFLGVLVFAAEGPGAQLHAVVCGRKKKKKTLSGSARTVGGTAASAISVTSAELSSLWAHWRRSRGWKTKKKGGEGAAAL